MRRPEPEPADFVQKIRLGTTTEEEAKQGDSAEPLERHAPKRGREQRAKEPAPPVGGTQQWAKGPTPIPEEVGEQEESRVAQKEATNEQVLPDIASEQIFPDLGSEQFPEPETGAREPDGRQEQQPEPPSGSAESTPIEEESHGLENRTMQQCLRWFSEQVWGVVDQLDEEERCGEYLTRTTTQELVSLRTQIQGLQEELVGRLRQPTEQRTNRSRADKPSGKGRRKAWDPRRNGRKGVGTQGDVTLMRRERVRERKRFTRIA